MSAPNDGGSAFPFVMPDPSNYHTETGMTLRDWFAGMALQGIISSIYCTPQVSFMECAGRAYCTADAMIAARERKEDA